MDHKALTLCTGSTHRMILGRHKTQSPFYCGYDPYLIFVHFFFVLIQQVSWRFIKAIQVRQWVTNVDMLRGHFSGIAWVIILRFCNSSSLIFMHMKMYKIVIKRTQCHSFKLWMFLIFPTFCLNWTDHAITVFWNLSPSVFALLVVLTYSSGFSISEAHIQGLLWSFRGYNWGLNWGMDRFLARCHAKYTICSYTYQKGILVY